VTCFGTSSVPFVHSLKGPMHLKEPLKPVGTPVGEYLKALVECNPRILDVSILTYRQPPPVEERSAISSADVERLVLALALRGREGMPFWDAVMLSCFNNRNDTPEGLLQAALFHQPMKSCRDLISRSTIVAGGFEQIALSEGGILAVGSEVSISDLGRLHLPLLDFHCRESPENDRLVESVCRLLFDCTVAICRSGKSYHAYGLMAVTLDELRQFLYRALLFAPVVDRAYVAHQLIEGQCALRISPAPTKPFRPQVKFLVRLGS
jgi:hypothetical protein